MSRTVVIAILIIVSVLLSTLSFYAWQIFKTPNLQVGENDKDFELFIPRGATFETVMDSLNAHQVVNDKMSFRFLARFMKYNENVKNGRYIIKKKMSNQEAIRKLRSGAQDPMKLTFNNIRLKDELITKLGAKFEFGPNALDSLLKDPTVCAHYGFDTTTIMCMFLPNTYEFFWTTSADNFLDRMGKEYKKFWTPERQQKAKAMGLTQTQVQTLASIVESESKANDEKPRVAGVYWNRLQKGMLLEADPTLVFALRDFTIRRVLNVHKQIDSPYNTYKYKGLPPGPINLPTLSSIDAVLNHENHDYLYFVARPDFSGHHTFAKTYDEHMNNARMYHAELNKRGIMK
ncbi:endolytic transglycosylase MltG [Larkinella rosea]|uniref:Endolytic murein transglycosylase n=1 Tax=Larkinella rosea TaxID=2025312 RepID=A0A3P1BZJ9_9BACT|nr:endolytic transglycosylase MltG [Larkinella rosea]RRB06580.1 endolytic transglycosylase MltG [Larkinella rosea]